MYCRTVVRQAPLSMGFSREEYWSGLPCPPPEGLPDPEIESRSLTLREGSLLSEPPGKPTDGGYKLKREVTDYSRVSSLDN